LQKKKIKIKINKKQKNKIKKKKQRILLRENRRKVKLFMKFSDFILEFGVMQSQSYNHD
jgi:hypothetical protein